MDFETEGSVTDDELKTLQSMFISQNTLGWRYIPKVGAPGAELSQFVLYPQGMEVEKAQKGVGNLKWTEMTPMQNPNQYWIINSLAALPIKKITQSLLMEGQTILRAMGARVIE